MNKTGIVICVCVAMLSASCKRNTTEGHGKISTEARSLESFTSVEIGAPLDVKIVVDSTKQSSCTLKGYQNLLEKINTKVENGILIIDKEDIINFYTDHDVIATITVPSLKMLTIKGAADADIQGTITGDNFSLKVSGAGDVVIHDLNTNSFESVLAGAGDLTIKKGNVNNVIYQVRGAGDVDAYALLTKNTKASVSGAGDIEVNVSENLDARISGAGSISYKGHPKVQSDINGIGEVEAAN